MHKNTQNKRVNKMCEFSMNSWQHNIMLFEIFFDQADGKIMHLNTMTKI